MIGDRLAHERVRAGCQSVQHRLVDPRIGDEIQVVPRRTRGWQQPVDVSHRLPASGATGWMDAAGRAGAAGSGSFVAAREAVRVRVDTGCLAVEDRPDDGIQWCCRVVRRVGAVGDVRPAPRVPGQRSPYAPPASQLLLTALAGVLGSAGQDHVAYPLQFVDGADERAGVVVRLAWDARGDDQVVPGGAESVWRAVLGALPQRGQPALWRKRAVAYAARLRREAGHGPDHRPRRNAARQGSLAGPSRGAWSPVALCSGSVELSQDVLVEAHAILSGADSQFAVQALSDAEVELA